MATILPFVIRPRASAVAHAHAGDAAIVIFPGVRYEPPRGGDAGGPRKAGDNGSRKRKNKTS